jgi:hypothetical protein
MKESKNTMKDSLSKKWFLWLTLTVTAIGVVWIIIAGIVRNSFWLTAIPLLLGIACIAGAVKLYSLRPDRAFAILGITVLWYIVTNFVFANLLSLSIPGELSDVNAPFLAARLTMLNIQIGFLSSVGFMFIIMDLTGGRRK